MAFEKLLYFINVYLGERNQGNYTNEDVSILFNRDMEINETEVIENCQKSKGLFQMILSLLIILGLWMWKKKM